MTQRCNYINTVELKKKKQCIVLIDDEHCRYETEVFFPFFWLGRQITGDEVSSTEPIIQSL